jgi:hypothetical protein
MNETVTNVTLHLCVKPMKFWWMQLQTQVRCVVAGWPRGCELCGAVHALPVRPRDAPSKGCGACSGASLGAVITVISESPHSGLPPPPHTRARTPDGAVVQDADQHRPGAGRRGGRGACACACVRVCVVVCALVCLGGGEGMPLLRLLCGVCLSAARRTSGLEPHDTRHTSILRATHTHTHTHTHTPRT